MCLYACTFRPSASSTSNIHMNQPRRAWVSGSQSGRSPWTISPVTSAVRSMHAPCRLACARTTRHRGAVRTALPQAQRSGIRLIPLGTMAMTLRLTDDQAAALRARAEREGRSMQQVAVSALDEYLLRTQDDELTDRIA